MEKLTLTPEQAFYLLDMLLDHAEWSDPLFESDRLLWVLIDRMAGDMPKTMEAVKASRMKQREELAEENRKRQLANEANQ